MSWVTRIGGSTGLKPYVKPELTLIKLDIMPKAKPAASQEAKQEPEPRGCAPIQAIVMPKRGKLA